LFAALCKDSSKSASAADGTTVGSRNAEKHQGEFAKDHPLNLVRLEHVPETPLRPWQLPFWQTFYQWPSPVFEHCAGPTTLASSVVLLAFQQM